LWRVYHHLLRDATAYHDREFMKCGRRIRANERAIL
jgi:hypothetical protein